MTDTVAFLDAEALAVAYLRAELAGRGDAAYVATVIPRTRRERMVKVTRTGGARRDEITDMPQLTFECWDTDSTDASLLAALARALMWALPNSEPHGHLVRDVDELGGPVYFEDTETALPRYQFSVVLNVRGETI